MSERDTEAVLAVAAAISAATKQVDAARAAYDSAAEEYESAKLHADRAKQNAQALEERAVAAEELSDVVRRLLVVVLRQQLHPSPSFGDFDALLGHGATDTLLAALGSVERLRTLAADTERITEVAVQYRDHAAQLRTQADRAATVGTEALLDELESAQSAAADELAAAEDALQDLQIASLASSGTRLTLPTDEGQLSDAGWVSPTTGTISGGFGARPNKPTPSSGDFHYGLDVAADCGTPIYAATGGTVVEVGRLGGYGFWVLLDNGSGVETGYAHLPHDGVAVTVGQVVAAGEPIGLVGTTGWSTGCHLHFEVRLDGVRIDPIPFLTVRGVTVG